MRVFHNEVEKALGRSDTNLLRFSAIGDAIFNKGLEMDKFDQIIEAQPV